MRRLDFYILRELLGPFVLSLAVVTAFLVLDIVPDIVELVRAKGLPLAIILRVFALNLAWMMALAVPMAILAGTLMGFVRLAGDSEIVALKAAGVSIYRMIVPVLIVGTAIAGGLIWFNNSVLPDANHSARVLMGDIRRTRPTLAVKENVIVDRIPGYHLLVRHLNEKTDSIADVTIFDSKDRALPRTVVARSGRMQFSPDGNTLILDLIDGEIHESDPEEPDKYRRTSFAHQTFNLSGVGTGWEETDSDYRTDREKSAERMLADIAGWRELIVPHRDKIRELVRTPTVRLLHGTLPPTDSGGIYFGFGSDATAFVPAPNDSLARDRAYRKASRTLQRMRREVSAIDNQNRLIDQYYLEIHKKYSIPAACLVFVLVGSSLGIRVRTRGLQGLMAGIGVTLLNFLIYWAFLVEGEVLADRGLVSPALAMWSPNIIVGLLGAYLLRVATRDNRVLPTWLARRIARGRRANVDRDTSRSPTATLDGQPVRLESDRSP